MTIMSAQRNILDFLEDEPQHIEIIEVELELHGVFWFHTYAQPRDKYTHITIPVIHNYPLTIAFLGLPVESAYVSVSNKLSKSIKPEDVWSRHGFYIYPAIAVKSLVRTLTFSMGGTGYMAFKPKTRASIPDYTANQVFLPGSIFKTFVLLKPGSKYAIPRIVRLGSKRFGVFHVKAERRLRGNVKDYQTGRGISHPFNVKDCPAKSYHGILHHYAGNIALDGVPERVIVVRDLVLAAPSFL